MFSEDLYKGISTGQACFTFLQFINWALILCTKTFFLTILIELKICARLVQQSKWPLRVGDWTEKLPGFWVDVIIYSVTVDRLQVTRMLNASRNRGCYPENYKRIFFHSFFKKPWVFRTGPGLKITSSLIKSLFKRFMWIYEIFTVIHFWFFKNPGFTRWQVS